MPKPIPISIEIEELALGRVWRALDTMPGVISIKLHGSGPRQPLAARASNKRGGNTSLKCVVLGALMANGGPLARDAIGDAVEKAGWKRASVPDALSGLGNAKQITRIKKGKFSTFKITPAGVKRYETACVVSQEK